MNPVTSSPPGSLDHVTLRRHDAEIAPAQRSSQRTTASEPPSKVFDERLATHLLTMLSVSAGMVGVCLTANGLLGISRPLTREESLCDDILAINSLVYLSTAGLCFAGLRTPLRLKANSVALAVDVTFCIGLCLTTVACFLLARFVVD